jgi:hypothetical protein
MYLSLGLNWLPNATIALTTMAPYVPTPTVPTMGASFLTNVLGFYAMPSANNNKDRGDVVKVSFQLILLLHVLFWTPELVSRLSRRFLLVV